MVMSTIEILRCRTAALHPTSAFPTDAKEREKLKRNAEKEQGIERVVQKRKKSWNI